VAVVPCKNYIANLLRFHRVIAKFSSPVFWRHGVYSPNSTWLVAFRHDTFDVSSPCILAVSSLSNSTARHVKRVVPCRDVTSQVELGLITTLL